jgi:hypothetical protein
MLCLFKAAIKFMRIIILLLILTFSSFGMKTKTDTLWATGSGGKYPVIRNDSLKNAILKADTAGIFRKCTYLKDTTYITSGSIYDSVGKAHHADSSDYVKNLPATDSSRIADSSIYVRNPSIVLAGTGITVTRASDSFTVALYSPPSIIITNNHLINYAGQSVATDSVSWTLSGSTIKYQTLTDIGALSTADRYHNFTGPWTTDKYWTLTVTDSTAPITNITATTWVYFQIQKYMDTCASAAPSEAQIRARASAWTYQNSAYRVLVSTSITGGGKYIYYAYPSAWGVVSIYGNGFFETWNLTTVSITNTYGDTRNYYVYTSPFPIVGTISLEAKIP